KVRVPVATLTERLRVAHPVPTPCRVAAPPRVAVLRLGAAPGAPAAGCIQATGGISRAALAARCPREAHRERAPQALDHRTLVAASPPEAAAQEEALLAVARPGIPQPGRRLRGWA